MKVTLDNNCLISLENKDNDSLAIQQIIDLRVSGVIQVFIPAIAASENRRENKIIPNFKEFEQYLLKMGYGDCSLLSPLVYLGVTYLDHSVYGSTDLEEKIHNVLFPKIPFKYKDYSNQYSLPTNGNVDRKWRNAKCDVLAMWCHIHYGNDVFMTNDGNFHKISKKPRLIKLGAKEILKPAEVLRRIQTI